MEKFKSTTATFKLTFGKKPLFKIRKRNTYEILSIFLIIFIILFPKGGIKVAAIPLTIGYGILFFLAGLCLTLYTYSGKIRFINKTSLICLLAILPFFAVSSLKIIAAGSGSLGFLISFYISLFFIPTIFLLLFYHPLKHLEFDLFKNLIKSLVFITALYGIFLFFYKFYTGSFIQIPLLTVNLGDLGQLEKKHIDRGGIFKLISTYNNGNVYGVCMLMLLPLYCYIEDKSYKKLIVKVALLLTLSRTIWIGLILNEAFSFVFLKKKTVKSMVGVAAAFLLLMMGLLVGLSFINQDILFLFDSSLGGRMNQVNAFVAADFFPSFHDKFVGIEEMVYFSITKIFGWLGLLFFILYISTPFVLFLFGKIPNSNSKYKKAMSLGLVIYMIVAFVDGAILHIPTMAIYWLVVSLLLKDFDHLYIKKKTSHKIPFNDTKSLEFRS